MLAEVVDVVIGVDTHKHTHTAAAVAASTGAALDEETVATDPVGYDQPVAMADRHGGPRAWAIEGTGGYGAGLKRHLQARGERVIELDRPNRPARRNGAKSDPLDALRAAREALAPEHLAQPRAAGERSALSVLLTARRSAVAGTTVAQRQLSALVTAAPESLRRRFRGQNTRHMVATAARLRVQTSRDTETAAAATRPPSPTSPAWPRSPPRPARPSATASTAAATANSTGPSTSSRCTACATTPTPTPTHNGDEPTAKPTARSAAASSATSPASSTDNSKLAYRPLDEP